MTDEEKAKADADADAAEAAKAKEEADKAGGGEDTSARSFIRSLVAKSFGRSSKTDPKAPDLSQVRSKAKKYDVKNSRTWPGCLASPKPSFAPSS